MPTTTPYIEPPEVEQPPADVLIAEFDARHASRTIEIARRLEEDLKAQLLEHGLHNVIVRVIPRSVTAVDGAHSLARDENGKVVIWGWYDDLGISVRIFLAEGDQAGIEVPGSRELPLELADETTTHLSFVVRDVLPENISFLSLYIIGQLHYLANEYQAGHDAFDAAMASIPETAVVENEAILHFFRARQLAVAETDDMTAVVCEFARAVELDPAFAEAYHNLGIIFAQVYEPMFGVLITNEAQSCLEEAGFDVTPGSTDLNPPSLFDRALQLQPALTLAEYNKLGFYWENLDELKALNLRSETEGIVWLKAELEVVVQRDPSILGAYIVLGNIALEDDDFETASHWYSSARTLAQAPESAKIHFNLGQIYLRNGQEEQAEAEFEAALAADAQNSEAHLALANLLYQRGQTESALRHLGVILPFRGPTSGYPLSPDAMAMLLRSRAHFNAGESELAIEMLEQLLSAASFTPLEHYLLGLLYALNGDAEMASERWIALRTLGSPVWDSNASSALAWFDIAQRCEFRVEGELFDWDLVNPCLPTDLPDRISTVYDLFQDRLPYRIYYRIFWYGGLGP